MVTENIATTNLAFGKYLENFLFKPKFCKNKPISFEVFADDQKSMIEQGKKINTWGKNIYVKVPVVNSKNKFTGNVIKELNNKNIKLNITAVYTAKQTAKILKVINKKTKVIISIFAGRAGDTGKDPIPEFVKSIKLAKNYKNVEILWASVREPYNYTQANSALKRNVKLEEIGNAALYFVSDLSNAVTGEVHYVDCGFNILGMPKSNT